MTLADTWRKMQSYYDQHRWVRVPIPSLFFLLSFPIVLYIIIGIVFVTITFITLIVPSMPVLVAEILNIVLPLLAFPVFYWQSIKIYRRSEKKWIFWLAYLGVLFLLIFITRVLRELL